MSDDRNSASGSSGVLLMKTWSDTEAEMVRQILENDGIPCQVVSDVPHSVWPINVDGLGEIRILVPTPRLEDARALIAEHRRQGAEAMAGNEDTDAGTPTTRDTSTEDDAS